MPAILHDDTLLTRIVDHRDTNALEILHKRYTPRIVAIARRYNVDSESAFDIAQEVLLDVWQNCSRYTSGGSFSTVISHITRTKIADYYRRQGRQRRVKENDGVAAENAELRTEVADVLMRLPPRQRLVLMLSAAEGRTVGEIANVLGLPKVQVSQILADARAQFKTILGSSLITSERK
jgi:RNA polymerase sigma factor (sigma-70 family)